MMSTEFEEEMLRLASRLARNDDEQAISAVAHELETIFGTSGSKVVLREFSTRYAVTLGDALKRPGVFQQALFFLLGELGSNLVMDRISRRVQSVAQTPMPNVNAY